MRSGDDGTRCNGRGRVSGRDPAAAARLGGWGVWVLVQEGQAGLGDRLGNGGWEAGALTPRGSGP